MAEIPRIVTSEADYKAVQLYVIRQARFLAVQMVRSALSVDTVTLFSRSEQEYACVEQLLRTKGPESRLSHWPTLYVDVDEIIDGEQIRYLGVRKPDPTRTEVGYADYPIDDFTSFCVTFDGLPGIQHMQSGLGQELLEFKHPDFAVRGYVVSARSHS